MKEVNSSHFVSRAERSNLLVITGLLTIVITTNLIATILERLKPSDGIYVFERYGFLPFANFASAFLILLIYLLAATEWQLFGPLSAQ